MPLYEFEHIARLTASQKSSIARAITNWHATTFHAPKFIIGCRFVDISQGPLSETYIGGEPRKVNRLLVSLRSGAGRTPEQLEDMTMKVVGIWDAIVEKSAENELRTVFIKSNLDSAREGGFMLPLPGKFQQWVKDNADEFKRRADLGDVDMIGLMQEIETREEFQREKV